MGNSQVNFSFSNFTTHQWTTVIPPRRQLTGTPSLCQAEDPRFQADCYDITVHTTIEQQMEILLNRKNISNDHIVRLLDVRLKKKQMFECNLKERLQIYTQKIICRLGEFPLNNNQALFLLRETILTFTVLVNFSKQYFIVTQKMIGFSSEGWVRIWLNENFGYSELKQQNLARSQYEMIISIVKCFQNLGIRVQDYYSFSRFQQLIAHLNMRLSGLQTQCIMKVICSKAKKCLLSDQFFTNQTKQSQTEASFIMQRHQANEMIQNHLENRHYQCENPSGKVYKQNIKPFRQINILQEFDRKNTPVYRYEAKQSGGIPSQVFSTSKKSLKQLTSQLSTSSSLKLIDRPKKETTTPASVQFSKNKSIEFSDTTNITDCQEFAQVPPSREITLQKPKLLCRPLPLHPQLDVMSRITERSHEDDTQYIGTQRQANPNDPEILENRSIRRSHSSQKPIVCSSELNQENYFTRIDL